MVGSREKNHQVNYKFYMTDNKQHIDIDLEFLDKNSKRRSQSIHDKTRKNTHTPKLQLSKSQIKKYLIIGGVIIFFGWAIFSDDGSSSNSTKIKPTQSQTQNITPTKGTSFNKSLVNTEEEEYMILGEYRCLMYHYNKAGELEPSKSKEASLESERIRIDNKGRELEKFALEIENMYVDEYSQWSVDNYNSKLNSYNRQFSTYESDYKKFQYDIDSYNNKVIVYNNYLENNCTLNR